MLKVRRLAFSYGSHQILHSVSFDLQKGSIGCLIGASGSGKTTIFKLLTGLIEPQKGTLSIDGEFIPQGHGKVAYMMQDDLLLSWRTVSQNMTLVGELGKRLQPLENLRAEARRLLKEMGLEGWEDRYPESLSGGMRQRVSLARALLLKRPLLLLDEPFGSLDVSLREQMYALLRQVQSRLGTTMLMVTHDFRDALTLADEIFLLDQGCIRQKWQITPEIRQQPQKLGCIAEEMKKSIINCDKSPHFNVEQLQIQIHL